MEVAKHKKTHSPAIDSTAGVRLREISILFYSDYVRGRVGM